MATTLAKRVSPLDAVDLAAYQIYAQNGIWTDGTAVFSGAALATNATDGFTNMPSMAGPPSGTPTAYTGTVPIVFDTTDNRLYFYSGAAWLFVGAAAAGTPWDEITAPDENTTIAMTLYTTTFTWATATTQTGMTWTANALTTGSLFALSTTSTALSGTVSLMTITMSGANTNAAVTAQGVAISVTNTNATSGTNIALNLTASGATTANYALQTSGNINLTGSPTISGAATASGVWTFSSAGTAVVVTNNISAAAFLGPGTAASTGALRLANTAAINWRNAANTGDLLLTMNASNQLTLGSSSANGAVATIVMNPSTSVTVTNTWATPAASRTYTIPDAGAATANYVLDQGTYTIAGTWGFGGIISFTNGTDASSVTTGTVVVTGGIGASKAIYSGEGVVVGGTTPAAVYTNIAGAVSNSGVYAEPGASTGGFSVIQVGATTNPGVFIGFKTRGNNVNSQTALSANDEIVRFAGYGSDGTNQDQAGSLRLYAQSIAANTSLGGWWDVTTSTSGGVATKAMAIDQAQVVYVGTLQIGGTLGAIGTAPTPAAALQATGTGSTITFGNTSNITAFAGTTDASSQTTGAVTVAGGLGVAKTIWAGTGVTIAAAGTFTISNGITMTTTLTLYNNTATAWYGIPVIHGAPDSRTGLTAADGAANTILAGTVAGALYRITADIFATAYTSGTATYTVTWTENAGTRTMVVSAAALNTLGTATDLIRPDTGTNITAQLTGTFTATVDVAAFAERVK